MFSLGIFSATLMELKGILDELKAAEISLGKDGLEGFKAFSATINGKEVLFACLGTGILQFSFNLGIVLGALNLKKAILVGTAGVFPHSRLEIGDIAVAEVESLWEARDQRLIPHLLSQLIMEPQRPLYWEEVLKFLNYNAISSVPMLTVLNPSKDMEESYKRQEESKAECENMEGYAFYFCLNKSGVPGVEIRAISNIAGERDKSKWDILKACESIKGTVLFILKEGVIA